MSSSSPGARLSPSASLRFPDSTTLYGLAIIAGLILILSYTQALAASRAARAVRLGPVSLACLLDNDDALEELHRLLKPFSG